MTSYKWATRIKLKIFPQNEGGQVNVNSRGQSFYNLRQHIDPLRRYGDIANYVFEAIACKLCL